jgi:hypothetical protein
MKPEYEKIAESLQKTSSTIFGFIVIQSILLSYQLNKPEFVEKLRQLDLVRLYIIIGHFVLLAGSIIAVIFIHNKIQKYLDHEINKITNSKLSVYIKVLVMIYFGIMPPAILILVC